MGEKEGWEGERGLGAREECGRQGNVGEKGDVGGREDVGGRGGECGTERGNAGGRGVDV